MSTDLEKDGWEKVSPSGFSKSIGPLWEKLDNARVISGFCAAENHSNSLGKVHGGALMGLAEHGLGVVARVDSGGGSHAMIQMDIQFMAGANIGDFIVVHGYILRRTNRLVFARAELTVLENCIAQATGILKILT